MRVRLVGFLALMALVVASCGGAVPEAAGPSEGIQVHGDWTLDIYNEDGTLDRSVEFSNDLTTWGSEQLAGLLAGSSSAGDWTIEFNGSPDACPSSPTCRTESIEANLEAGSNVILLSGSVIVEADSTIGHVGTRLGTCGSVYSPDNCTNSNSAANFTLKVLPPEDEVPVSAGQTVQVTVEISFTSA